MSDCTRIRQLLSERLDEPDDGPDVLQSHLDGCADCRRFRLDCEALHELARSEPCEEPPASLKTGVMLRLRMAHEGAARRFLGFVFTEVAAAALATLLLIHGAAMPDLSVLSDPTSLLPSSIDLLTSIEQCLPGDAAAAFYPDTVIDSLTTSFEQSQSAIAVHLADGALFSTLLAAFATLLLLTLAANLLVVQAQSSFPSERTVPHDS